MKRCREIVALVVAREDRALTLGERLSVRTHMLICRRCPPFEQQMQATRELLRAWRRHTRGDDDGGNDGGTASDR